MPTIDGHTGLLGLLGYPLEHTLSPAMHNAAFDALGLNYCYLALAVAPQDLAAAMAGLVALRFAGINVTIPHKQAVMPYLDEISEEAAAIGAVNTIVFENGKGTGYNTDGAGFLKAMADQGISVKGFRALVLGAGGASRAVVYSLLKAGATVTLLNRTEGRAHALADELRRHLPDIDLISGPMAAETIAAIAPKLDLVVNTTSAGMSPHEKDNPWPADVPFPAGAIAYDLVYAPLETVFLRTAEASGARTIGGLQMLINQGALAFEKWTGKPAPVDVMTAALTGM